MRATLNIREARESDAGTIAALIQSLAGHFLSDAAGAGAEGFLASVAAPSIQGFIADPAFHYLVACYGPRLAGVAALKNGRQLYHLFVQPNFHRQGLATALWHRLRDNALAGGSDGHFVVNASLSAVPVYRAFGFVPQGQPQERQGVRYQGMHFSAAGSPALSPSFSHATAPTSRTAQFSSTPR